MVGANLIKILSWAVVGLVCTPLLTLSISSWHAPVELWEHVKSYLLWNYFQSTFWLLIGVIFWASLFGIVTSYLVSHYEFLGSKVFKTTLLFPFATPAYLLAYVYTDLLQFTFDVRTIFFAALCLGLSLYPYVYLFCLTGFQLQSRSLKEASWLLGKSDQITLLKLTLPLMRPFYFAGIILVIMEALNDFGTVDYFAVDTFTTGIYRSWYGLGSIDIASRLSVFLLLIVILVLFLQKIILKGSSTELSAKRINPLTTRRLSGLNSLLAGVTCLIPITLGFLVPLGFFLYHISFFEGWRYFDYNFLAITGRTLFLSLSAGLLCVGVGFILAYRDRYFIPAKLKKFFRLGLLGYAVPGSLIAIGLLKLLNITSDYFPGIMALSGSLIFLLLAYLIRFLAIGFKQIDASLEKIPRSLHESNQLLKKSSLGRILNLGFVFSRPAILASFLIIFVDVAKELPATILLAPFNFETMALHAYHLASDERITEASPICLSLLLMGLIPMMLLSMKFFSNPLKKVTL